MTLVEEAGSDNEQVSSHPEVTVLADRCAGCQECYVRCPTQALQLDESTWTIVATDDLCVGCRQCVRTCPFSAIVVSGPVLSGERVESHANSPAVVEGSRSETRTGFATWQEALREAERCLACPDPTCVRGCPAHNDIPSFVSAIREGDLARAHSVLRRTSILPDVCSRVCDQAVQCEGSCSWCLAGEKPVAIGALERFVTENAHVPPLERTSRRGEGLKVAVIGSGPAAASAAWELVQQGASVSVFEKDEAPGGLMRWGIPEFTLPRAVSRRVWDDLVEAGVDLVCNTTVPVEELEDMKERYDALVVAAGAGSPLRLGVPGADLDGVWDATRFLSRARDVLEARGSLSDLDSTLDLGLLPDGSAPTVLVLGAGNTAMDTARMARRLGARAVCVDWMNRSFAPVRPDELAEAEEEGVEVRFLTTLARLIGENGRVARAVLSLTEQHRRDRSPVVRHPEADQLRVAMVVMAMGYRLDPKLAGVLPGLPLRKSLPELADRRWLASGILSAAPNEWSRNLDVGALAMGRELLRQRAVMALRERIWVVGDSLGGPSTVVEAMAQGKLAAQGIVNELTTH